MKMRLAAPLLSALVGLLGAVSNAGAAVTSVKRAVLLGAQDLRERRNAGVETAIPFLHPNVAHVHAFQTIRHRLDVGEAGPEFV